jgi:hypothetical protein
MKELRGQASATVTVAKDECLRFLAAVDGYPEWYPEAVREAQVLERDSDGNPAVARAKLHISRGPLVRDFDLTMAVRIDPAGTVTLDRIATGHGDRERFIVTWSLDAESRLSVELDANLSVPRMMPLGGLADSIATGFLEAAVDALGR